MKRETLTQQKMSSARPSILRDVDVLPAVQPNSLSNTSEKSEMRWQSCLDELDIFIMGQLASNLHIEERTLANKRVPKVREKPSTAYYHRGVRVINLLLDPSKVHDCSYPTTDLPENIHVPSWNREVSLGCPENKLSKKWNSDKVTFISN